MEHLPELKSWKNLIKKLKNCDKLFKRLVLQKIDLFLNKNVKKKNNNIVSKVNLAKRVIFIVPRNTTLALLAYKDFKYVVEYENIFIV